MTGTRLLSGHFRLSSNRAALGSPCAHLTISGNFLPRSYLYPQIEPAYSANQREVCPGACFGGCRPVAAFHLLPPRRTPHTTEKGDEKMIVRTRILTDILMLLLFLLLMAAHHTGSVAHEWLGLFLAAAFLLHTRLNRAWYKTLGKGRYNASRSIRFFLNALLLLSMIGTFASAVFISRTVFAFAGFKGELFFRTLHVLCAHWCFILAAIHFGMYGKQFGISLGHLISFPRSGRYYRASFCMSVAFSVYGIHAFLYRELMYPLTMNSSFMLWSENTALFFLDYSAIFFLCAWLAARVSSLGDTWHRHASLFIKTSDRKKTSTQTTAG